MTSSLYDWAFRTLYSLSDVGSGLIPVDLGSDSVNPVDVVGLDLEIPF